MGRSPAGVERRIRGALLGGMIGDALGLPFEMMSGSDPRLEPALAARLAGRDVWRTSDDTEMTISVAESLLRNGTVDDHDLLTTLAANYDPARGYGHGMRRALEAVRRGERNVARGTWPEGSKGNGGAIRVAPIACAFHDDLERVAALSDAAAAVSHAHADARGAAVAHALATATLIAEDGEVGDAAAWIDRLVSAPAVARSSVAKKLEIVKTLLARGAGTAEAARAVGNGVLADETVPLAIFAFLRGAAVGFEDTVRETILAGGDTDSAAALSGTLAGAHAGDDALPHAWLVRVERGARGVARLGELADGLIALANARAAAR
jgi:poly(ADP-ribose) glycohydrolase ARH3